MSLEPPITRTNLHDPEEFASVFMDELRYGQGVSLRRSSANDRYFALAHTVRRALMARWLDTLTTQMGAGKRAVAYLSAEYLLGRQLDNGMLAVNLHDSANEALASLGVDIEELRGVEVEPGLGNGGLGRLAACFIDSLATMEIPAVGYGIRYEYGIFRQEFVDGWQREQPDPWLEYGSPWEFPHPEMAVTVGFGGSTVQYADEDGAMRTRWLPDTKVLGVPYNYMVPGYHTRTVNTLRLWCATSPTEFRLDVFNAGDFEAAVHDATAASNISRVLYPEDSTPQGKELRLKQQYFFVACSITDFIRNVLPPDFDLHDLGERVIFQLNDTHPVIGVPELMRVLMDEHQFDFQEAWAVTQDCFAYTCHTLLPEALEVWPVELMQRLLPRHMEIIFQINDHFLGQLRQHFPGDEMRVRRMSIIQEHPNRAVRMAYLATVAGNKVNGVAALHSDLLRTRVLNDFAEVYPEKFTNITNGITPRRFLRLSNPGLSDLITEHIGDGWVRDLDELQRLVPLADDPEFRAAFRAVKAANKRRLTDHLASRDIAIDPDTMFDVMVKRLHEYKRQTLKVLHTINLHQRLRDGEEIVPRTVMFGAKAAAGYRMAKDIIGLINHVGVVINNDPACRGKLAVAYPPNYNVTLAEILIPAADLSEQISLAGKEASGTGNMKFALNGALTIGTLDGANVEIRDLVGAENFFLFGMTVEDVHAVQAAGYQPWTYYENDPVLRRALDAISSGEYSGGDGSVFAGVVENLVHQDRFMALADFEAYLSAQEQVEQAYRDADAWSRMAILNVANVGFFSSDRSIRDYLDRIWHCESVHVPTRFDKPAAQ
jgi:starch phosphorylase